MNETKNSVRTIFNDALDIPDPAQRASYVARACGSDLALRQKIEDLITADAAAGGFLSARSAAPDQPVNFEKPGDRVGPYTLLQKIGEGGCGIVYMAEQEQPIRRRVALKVIKTGMDTRGVIARFEAERQALALMDHPHIAKVLDAGSTEKGRPFFVMELIKGARLTEYCDQNHLPTRERLKLFAQVCQAIQHAHQKGVIHRDIKPSNTLVTIYDGVPCVKVIDFGIAKATEGALTDKTLFTAFEQFMGTPAYMSPEQARMSSTEVDARSDIYSLGVLLYELLTGRTPFDAGELLRLGWDEIRRIIQEEEPVRPSTRLSAMTSLDSTEIATHRQTDPAKLGRILHGDLDWIVMKALDKNRARRYETADALAADVFHHLNDEPVQARPPGARYRLRKLFRRHRIAFITGGSVLTTVALFALFMLVKVLPVLNQHANGQGHPAAGVMQGVMALSDFLRHWFLHLAILFGIVGYLFWKISRQPAPEIQKRGDHL